MEPGNVIGIAINETIGNPIELGGLYAPEGGISMDGTIGGITKGMFR